MVKKVLIVWAHPREDSLTSKVVATVRDELVQYKFVVSERDLYRSKFDAALLQKDEPDWGEIDKMYSSEVLLLKDELLSQDALFFVFPVWWYSFPAIMKGYIDRVFNYGIAYGGGRRLPFNKVRWIALAGEKEDAYIKRGFDAMIEHSLNKGIAGLCGADNSKVTILYNSLAEDITDWQAHYEDFFNKAREVTVELADMLTENSQVS